MELGEKIKHARLTAGLSQRQLCGDTITRNMLSLIESGRAKPSMDTLLYLANRLGRPVSYFLEDTPGQDNAGIIRAVRACHAAGDYRRGLKLLENYREPDGFFDREKQLLEGLCLTKLAAQTLEKCYETLTEKNIY